MTAQSDKSWRDLLEEGAEARERGSDWDSTGSDPWEEISKRLRYIVRVLQKSGLTKQDADDLVQGVLEKLQAPELCRRIARLSKPEGYMFVVLRNQARSQVRRRLAEARAVGVLRSDADKIAVPDARDDDGRVARLNEVLFSLSVEERGLVDLKFWQDLSIEQIGAELDISYSAAASRLFRLQKKLALLMGRARAGG